VIVRPSEIEERARPARPRLPPARVTRLLLASVAAAFLVQLWVGFENPYGLIRLGANLSALVAEGQWDRLVTANWLHGGWIHVGVNALGLFFMGTAIERLLGSSRYVIIYLTSCFGGAVASALASPGVPSVGASTGIVGLFASIGYILIVFRGSLPPQMRNSIRSWLLILALNVALWVAFSDIGIDHAGHGGGFAVGVLSTALVTIGWPPFVRRRSREKVTGAVAWILAAVTVAGLAVSTGRFSSGDRSGDAGFARAVLSSPEQDPLSMNYFAWFAVIDPESDAEMLGIALEMAQRGVEGLTGEEPGYEEIRRAHLDTLATAHYRLGHFDEAVRFEREVYEAEPTPIYGSQLARFLAARLDASGPLITPPDTPRVRLSLDQASREGGQDIVLVAPAESPTGFVVYGVVVDGGHVLGLVAVRVGPERAAPSRTPANPPWPRGARLRTALVDAASATNPDTGFDLSTVPMSEEIAGYP